MMLKSQHHKHFSFSTNLPSIMKFIMTTNQIKERMDWINKKHVRKGNAREKSGQALLENCGEVGSLEGFWRSCGHWQTLATNSPVLVCPHILCPHMWCPHTLCPYILGYGNYRTLFRDLLWTN